MNYLKKIGVSLFFSFGLFLVISFILTLLQYANIFSDNVLKIIFTVTIFSCFLIGGVLFGKKSIKKGWWEGIKLSIVNIVLLIIISLIFKIIVPKSAILYLIIFLSTTIGSIIGVNNRKKEN